MGNFIKKTLFVLAILLAALTTFVCVMEKEYCPSHKVLYSGWVYGFSYSISIISLVLSSWSHKQQITNQEEIKSDIKDLLSRPKSTSQQQNGIQNFKYQPSAMVEIALYAMHKASIHRPIKVDKILPNDIELFSIIIDSISSAYKQDVLYAYIDRNNMLVVPTFDVDNLPSIALENGNYGTTYCKKDRNFLERVKKRIDDEINN